MTTSTSVALVTGGSRGVGRGVAVALASAGWTVYVTGRSLDRLAETVAAAAEGPGRVLPLECDHADDAQVAEVFSRIATEQQRLDLQISPEPCGTITFAASQEAT